jgi:glycosyltransferase involved in cell wall biosynthesis
MHRGWGGQSCAVLILAEALHKRGHDVMVAGAEGSVLVERARDRGLGVFDGLGLRRGFRPFSFLRDLVAARRILKEHRTEIILTNGSQDTWVFALARALFTRTARVVRWRHNSFPVANHLFNRWLYRYLLDHVAVSSSRLIPILEKVVNEERITVFHPTTDPSGFANVDAKARLEVRKEFGVEDDETLIVAVGRLAPEKGHSVLLQAMARMGRESKPAKLAIVGKGRCESELRELISLLRLEKQAILTGFRSDIPRLYAGADLAALSPIGGESFGIAILEAFLSGLPAVATDVGGVSDLVRDGETGYLVPPGDPDRLAAALTKMLRDPAARAEMGRRAKALVLNNYTPEKLADTAENLFLQLLRKPRARE